jgi:uncharacterized protein (DUF4415 family)
MSYDWMANDDEDTPEAAIMRSEPAPDVQSEQPGKVGRPKGSTTSDRQQVALRMPRDVLDHFRAGGPGWQTRMIAVLRRAAEQATSSAATAQ